jgi:adenylate cyclase
MISLLSKLLALIAVWGLTVLYYLFMRVWGVEELPVVQRGQALGLTDALILGLIGGLGLGVPYCLADLLFDSPRFRRNPYGFIMLVKGSAQLLITALAGAILVVFATAVLHLTDQAPLERLREMLISRSAAMFIVTTLIVTFLINFFQVVQVKIGRRVLLNLLRGRYHSPLEEERVFMFLDLRSSTTYAERLGNLRYSRLIQDCFSDLTDTIRQHRVEVYQYVGDEAILTWTPDVGLRDHNCIEAYFHFEDRLEQRAPYYQAEYGFVPEFKAGVNCGVVTVAEVGIVKREIAYHSDVLNTAARIQAQCNEFGTPLLISEGVERQLPYNPRYEIALVGDIALRGKEQSVKIYSVSRTQDLVPTATSPAVGRNYELGRD